MMTYTEVEIATSKITRRIRSVRQPRSREGRAVAEMIVDSTYDRMEFDGVSRDKVLLNPRPVKRSGDPAQRTGLVPRRVFPDQFEDEKEIRIRKKDWDALVARIDKLEKPPPAGP